MSAAVRPSSVAPRVPRPAGFRRGGRSRIVITLAIVALAALGLTVPGGAAGGATTTTASTTSPTYTFDDEFTGGAGLRPSSKWSFQTGGGGWGNNELEQYTDRTANAHLDGTGHLAIVARKETYTGSDGITRNYTSARLFSSAAVSYGYAEARILLPAGQGLWPAFWSVGADITTVDWPICGEIDALESYNTMANSYGAIHAADYVKRTAYAYNVKKAQPGGLAGTWHTYAASKTASSISWYVDGIKYGTVNKSSLTTGQDWPYGQAQYLLLNLAVGGTGGGTPGPTVADTSTGGSTLLVDWVRTGSGLPPDAQ